MIRYWKVKEWSLSDRSKMKEWIKKNQHKYQIREIFMNNKLAVEYKEVM